MYVLMPFIGIEEISPHSSCRKILCMSKQTIREMNFCKVLHIASAITNCAISPHSLKYHQPWNNAIFLQTMYNFKKKTYHITKAGKKYLVFLKYLPFPPPSSRETTLILLLMSFLSIISHHFLVPKTSLSLNFFFKKLSNDQFSST